MRSEAGATGGNNVYFFAQNVIEWLGILSNDDNSPLVLINAPCLPRALQGVRGDF